MTESTANEDLQNLATERARWAAVLAPTGRTARRVTRKPGMLEKITEAAALAAIAAPMFALCTVPGLYHFFYM